MSAAPTKAEIRAEAARLLAVFEAEGAQAIETEILQPAGALLDLYGEDIRARAYTTQDPLEGEQMLRPDFTVPVVQQHMANGADPARYAYAGEVFRRQEDGIGRAREYIQVGYEVFDRKNPAEADAEVFALIAQQLAPLKLRAATGDIGILAAAVRGLKTSERRRAALLRHMWRPRRFRRLIERFAGRTPIPAHRLALLEAGDPFADAGPEIGLRSRAEVSARIDALRADAQEPPISSGEMALLDDILSLREVAPNALSQLRDIAVDMPSIGPAVSRLSARLDAMSARGIDVEALEFEATFGRASMEYYDGFVFGFYCETRPDLPPLASGGRYDALTRVLGQGREIPAVGGVLRPGLMLTLARGQEG
ncbi:MAG: ATP phosphoribosyltransferase regulatory subunit [Halocynthiibacter sp.]|jgi:ATP phosphoribosyltransferase regulatory subunit